VLIHYIVDDFYVPVYAVK